MEHVGTTSDLGLGGAFITTTRPPRVGSNVVVSVKLPTAWDPLELRAVVRWVSDGKGAQPTGFGARFHGLSGLEASALHELVHASAYSKPEG